MSEPSASENDVVLDVQDLVKQYAGAPRAALQGVSLQVRRGEVVGLLGPNGAGKTTLIEIVTGFRRADSGTIRVLGLNPAGRNDLRALRRRVGLVSQQVGHLRYLTVRETIDLHHAMHEHPRDVDEVLEMVGLQDAGSQRVRRLSGGQQRRLDVATALVGRPELILLDEPTTGFDPGARRHAWDVIERLAHDGTSILLTTHYMEEAARLADRVVVLGTGRVQGEGTPDELARQLQLQTVIRARVPAHVGLDELPVELRDGLVETGRLELRTVEPTPLLATLCTWAVQHSIPLEDLDVRAPSLEESYLTLTSEVSS